DVLEDPEPRVRAAAAAGLANVSHNEARVRGRERLNEMALSPEPEVRAAAAEALEHVEDRTAIEHNLRTRLLALLLRDSDVSVVLACTETIRSVRLWPLAPELLPLLGQPVVSGAASNALVAMGGSAVAPLLAYFEGRAGSRSDAVIAKIPEVLERIGDPRGLTVIAKMLTSEAPEQRQSVFRSYVRLVGRGRATTARRERIDALVEQECRAAAARLSSMRRLGRDPALGLTRDAVSDLVASHIQNAFVL